MRLKEIAMYLELEKPIEIQIKTKKKKTMHAAYWGMYDEYGELKYHLIRVYGFDQYRGFESLIAHELIHGWQEERHIDEIHGPQFRHMARAIEHTFQIENVYIPGVDID